MVLLFIFLVPVKQEIEFVYIQMKMNIDAVESEPTGVSIQNHASIFAMSCSLSNILRRQICKL